MIKKELVSFLKQHKNLLAFSAGGDSVALFFLLLEHNIPFDIAIVDYGVREQSKEEVAYAKSLAQQYKKQCYIFDAPKIKSNFEAAARKIRYQFFEDTIQKHHYQTLLMAHHLGDLLEWFLMQLTKGSGLVELLGMQQVEERSNYKLIRPLLSFTKEQLQNYLQHHQLTYFIDETNFDKKYTRNYFRHEYVNKLLQTHSKGIAKSFEYLFEDKAQLVTQQSYEMIKDCICFPSKGKRSDMVLIDKIFKQRGIVLSRFVKEELKEQKNCVISRKYLVVFYNDYIFLTPYQKQNEPLPKNFKEKCRKLKIEPKFRSYLYQHPEVFEFMLRLHQ